MDEMKVQSLIMMLTKFLLLQPRTVSPDLNSKFPVNKQADLSRVSLKQIPSPKTAISFSLGCKQTINLEQNYFLQELKDKISQHRQPIAKMDQQAIFTRPKAKSTYLAADKFKREKLILAEKSNSQLEIRNFSHQIGEEGKIDSCKTDSHDSKSWIPTNVPKSSKNALFKIGQEPSLLGKRQSVPLSQKNITQSKAKSYDVQEKILNEEIADEEQHIYRLHMHSIHSSMSSQKIGETKMLPQRTVLVRNQFGQQQNQQQNRGNKIQPIQVIVSSPKFKVNPFKKELNRDSLESINSSRSNSILTGRKNHRDGINDLPKDGQRHFRKLSKELERPKNWDDNEKIESEVITPTSTTKQRSLLSTKQKQESNSENNSFDNSIGSERLVNIIDKENKINIKKDSLQETLKNQFFD